MKLNYKIINKYNVRIAAKIQYEIFPESSAYTYYLDNLSKNGLPLELLIFYDNKPIGVVGLYDIDSFPDTIWLSWFGILKEYRRKGIGKQIIEDIKIVAKKYDKKFLRLYTYEVWNSIAQPFYNEVMEISEYYNNDKENQYDIKVGKPKIFGISLCNEKIEYWNNKFIDITKEDNIHTNSLKLLRKDGIIK